MYNKINNKVIFTEVLRGIILLLLFSVIMSAFSGIIFSLKTSAINWLLMFLNILILIYIGFNVARKAEHNGWLNGGIAGLLYMIILVIIGFNIIPISLIDIIILEIEGLVIGSIGGIFGVNF